MPSGEPMHALKPILVSTLILGSLAFTGCAEHRYRSYDPYYSSYGYYGNDPYYREWLAERRFDYIEYNRLSRERQREYWEWRRQNEARFRDDPRFRDNQRVVRNDRNDHDADDRRGRTYAQTRNWDRDRHQDDRDRHQVRDRDREKHDRDKHDKDDRDHDRR